MHSNTTLLKLVNFNLSTLYISSTDITFANHSMAPDLKIFPFGTAYYYFITYSASQFVFNFYPLTGDYSSFTKTVKFSETIASYNYDFKLINGRSIAVISFIVTAALPSLNKLYVRKVEILGSSTSNYSLYSAYEIISYSVSFSNLQFLKWAGNWLIINLIGTGANIHNSEMYSYVFTETNLDDEKGQLLTKTSLSKYTKLMDVLLLENISNREAYPILMFNTYISVPPGSGVVDTDQYTIKLMTIQFSGSAKMCFFFTNNDSSQYCSYECKKTQYFSKLTGYACSDCSPGFIKNNACVNTGCQDIEKANINGYCSDSDNYYMYSSIFLTKYTTLQAVPTCNKGFSSVNNICIPCAPLGKVSYNGRCENSCPQGYFTDPASKECYLVDCGTGYILNPIKSICVPCKNYRKFDLISEQCVETCNPGTNTQRIYCGCPGGLLLTIDSPYNSCRVGQCIFGPNINLNSNYSFCANPNNPYITKNNICSIGYVWNQQQLLCGKCTDTTYPYNLNGQCLMECPLNTVINYYAFECYPCNLADYVYNNSCVSICPIGTIALSKQQICINDCSATTVTSSTSTSAATTSDPDCYSECPYSDYYYDPINKICSKCPSSTPYRYKDYCLSECPPHSYYSPYDKKCYPCKTGEIYYADSQMCITECPDASGYTYDKVNNVCYNCLQKGLYYNFQELKCRTYCPNNYVGNLNIGCFFEGYVVYNNELYGSCPKGYEPAWNRVCYQCYNYINYTGKSYVCTDECPIGLYPDSSRDCKTCLSMGLIEAIGGGCTYRCDTLTQTVDLVNNKCIPKDMSLSDKILYEQSLNCSLTCNNNSACKVKKLNSTKLETYCTICSCGANYYGGLCEIDSTSKTEYETRLLHYLSLLPSTNELNNSQGDINYYGPTDADFNNANDLVNLIQSVPQLNKIEYAELLALMAQKIQEFQKRKNLTVDPRVLVLASNAIVIAELIDCYDKTNGSTLITTKSQLEDDAYSVINSNIMDNLLQGGGISQDAKSISTNAFATYTNSPRNNTNVDKIVSEKLPFADFSSCFSSSINYTEIYMSYNLKLNLLSNVTSTGSVFGSVVPTVVDSNFKPMNLTNCSNILIKLPINTNLLNLTKYNRIKQDFNSDIYLTSERLFNNLCQNYFENADLSVNLRRKVFSVGIECTGSCNYTEIDTNNYAVCNCNGTNLTSITANFKDHIFGEDIEESLTDVIKCNSDGFSKWVAGNVGFWLSSLLLCFFTAIIVLHTIVYSLILLVANYKQVLMSDACFMNINSDIPQYVGVSNKNNKQVSDQNMREIEKNIVHSEDEGSDENGLSNNDYAMAEPKVDKLSSMKIDLTYIPKEAPKNEKEINDLSNYYDRNKDDMPCAEDKTSREDNEEIFYYNLETDLYENTNKRNMDCKLNLSFEHEVEEKDVVYRKFTIKDFDFMGCQKEVEIDERTICQFTYDELVNSHILISVILKKSIVDPFIVRITKLSMSVSIILLFNAVLFTNSMINLRYEYSIIQESEAGFDYTFLNEIDKSIFASLISYVFLILITLINRVPAQYEYELNEALITLNKEKSLEKM